MRKAFLLLAGALMLLPAHATAGPNDPYLSIQWGLSKIDGQAAWTQSVGTGSIVAVVDTGVDLKHPDLRGRFVSGRDFVDDDNDPRDENGHGTLIAGIIAATTGNGIGVASVAPGARIMPVRVLDDDGSGSSSDVAEGIRWAVDHGADVVNLSLAQEGSPGGGGLLDDTLLRDPSIGDAIEDAARAGAVVVVAAGNDEGGGTAETPYDATVAGSLVVGSSTKDDRRAAHSNYGSGLDLLAPGGGSATDPADGGCTAQNSIVSTWWDPEDGKSKYGGGCGTSMAVAFVSGVAALLDAEGMSNAKIVNRIFATADDLGASGRDNASGYGRLDAARALGARVVDPPVVKRATRKSAPPRVEPEQVAAAGGGTCKSCPTSGEAVRTQPTPTVRSEPSEVPVVLAAPPEVPQTRGWPVTLASLLVAAMIVVHTLRLLIQEKRLL